MRQGGWKGQTGTRGGRDDRAERKDFLEEKVERRRNRGRGEGESGKQRAGITKQKKNLSVMRGEKELKEHNSSLNLDREK